MKVLLQTMFGIVVCGHLMAHDAHRPYQCNSSDLASPTYWTVYHVGRVTEPVLEPDSRLHIEHRAGDTLFVRLEPVAGADWVLAAGEYNAHCDALSPRLEVPIARNGDLYLLCIARVMNTNNLSARPSNSRPNPRQLGTWIVPEGMNCWAHEEAEPEGMHTPGHAHADD